MLLLFWLSSSLLSFFVGCANNQTFRFVSTCPADPTRTLVTCKDACSCHADSLDCNAESNIELITLLSGCTYVIQKQNSHLHHHVCTSLGKQFQTDCQFVHGQQEGQRARHARRQLPFQQHIHRAGIAHVTCNPKSTGIGGPSHCCGSKLLVRPQAQTPPADSMAVDRFKAKGLE